MSVQNTVTGSADQLAHDLLEGKIDPNKFLEEVTRLDQADPKRSAAINNLDVLERKPVKDYFDNNPDLQSNYYSLCSLSAWHVGQNLVINDPISALPYFRSALETARLEVAAIQESEYESNWISYIEGTIAYFNKDTEGLKIALEQCGTGGNGNILAKMLWSLESGLGVDYARDYDIDWQAPTADI